MKYKLLLMLYLFAILEKIVSLSPILAKDEECFFPSVYEGNKVNHCIYSKYEPPGYNALKTFSVSSGYWWCSTTSNYDYYKKWKVCEETGSTFGGNDPGKSCVFPFKYKNRIHLTCQREEGTSSFNYYGNSKENIFWWCATTKDFDKDGKWTRCRSELSQNLPCHFQIPEHHNNVGGLVGSMTHECQPFGDQWICSTEDGQLRDCPSSYLNKARTISSSEVILTEGGNDPENPCHFPFKATVKLHSDYSKQSSNRLEYSSCIPATSSRALSLGQIEIYPKWVGSWCATTDDFDRDGKWTRCLPESVNKYNYKMNLAAIHSRLQWLKLANKTMERKIPLSYKILSNSDFISAILDSENIKLEEETTSKDSCSGALDWFIWFVPMWNVLFNLNLTPPNNSDYALHGKNSDIKIHPLDRALKLPKWFSDLSVKQSWLNDNLGHSMNERWNSIRSSILRKWILAICLSGIIGFIICLLLCVALYIFYLKRNFKVEKYPHSQWQDNICTVYEDEENNPPEEAISECAECSAREVLSQECTIYSDSSHSIYQMNSAVRPSAPPSYEEITCKKPNR